MKALKYEGKVYIEMEYLIETLSKFKEDPAILGAIEGLEKIRKVALDQEFTTHTDVQSH